MISICHPNNRRATVRADGILAIRRFRGWLQASEEFVIFIKFYAGIAQLVERHLAKVNVAGSNPVSRSAFLLAVLEAFRQGKIGYKRNTLTTLPPLPDSVTGFLFPGLPEPRSGGK